MCFGARLSRAGSCKLTQTISNSVKFAPGCGVVPNTTAVSTLPVSHAPPGRSDSQASTWCTAPGRLSARLRFRIRRPAWAPRFLAGCPTLRMRKTERYDPHQQARHHSHSPRIAAGCYSTSSATLGPAGSSARLSPSLLSPCRLANHIGGITPIWVAGPYCAAIDRSSGPYTR